MKANILVVDDTPNNLRLLAQILTGQGYKVRPASNGSLALNFAQATPPDLILLDIRMQGMDGYAVCKALKAEAATRDIPVIFISALDEVRDKVKGFAAGGVDYITKPFQPDEVLARVKTHLTLQQLRTHLEELVEERTAELQQEIEERKHAEQQYRFLAEQTTDGLGILREERFIFVNDALAAILSIPAERLLGNAPAECFSEIGKALAGDNQCITEFPCTQGDREVWLEIRQNAIHWEGAPAMLVIVRDISEQKRKEEELKAEKHQLRRENVRLRSAMKDRYKFGDIIGRSVAMQEVYELVTRAAATDANVVIYGESGTGKDLIASTIHKLSNRRKRTFVPVNCGSIQETLFESEFFGHRKGSFTGALRDKPGFFDAANKGTLFLDEIGELPLAMQVKLLRALESGGYTPVGAHAEKHADVRIVAATNRNLIEEIRQGNMREDFFYRINVITINIPPLRERREDIPLLVEHFLQRFSRGEQPPLPGKILDALYRRNWPGNIRQLQNVLQRYLTLNRLEFGEEIHETPSSDADESIVQSILEREDMGLREAVEEFEKRIVAEILAHTGGNRSQAADILGIPRRTLRRRIDRHKIED